MKKTLLILLALAVLGGGAWYASTSGGRSAAPAPGEADRSVARAEKRDLDFKVEVSGDVTPAFQLDVKAEVGGKLKSLNVEPGAVVKAGDLVVEVDDRDLQTERESALTEIEGAKLQVEKNRRNFERAKDLFESKLISREVYDNLSSEFALAENSLVKSERRLQLVEDRLRKTKVLAPMDGTVLTVPVIEGQVVIAAASVNSGTTLMTIANLTKLLVETHINQVDVARLEMDQKVKLRAESFKDMLMEAKISFIAPVATVKNNVKGFQVQALIETPSDRLRPGMTVMMTVPIASASGAVSVPIGAVFKGAGNARVVYVRNGDSTEKREVKVGVTNLDYAQILNGVEPGEQILLVEPDRPDQQKKS
jgi:RND family efflux transporter MFP subunit